MNKELLQLLGLPETATEQQAEETIRRLKEKADKAESMTLAGITAAVDSAISERRITADKRDHFIELGKNAGIESLCTTLSLMRPASKPTDFIRPQTDRTADAHQTFTKLSEVPAEQMEKLRAENPQEYARLYKAEYHVDVKL